MFLPGDDDPLAGIPPNPASAAPDAFQGPTGTGALQPFGALNQAQDRSYTAGLAPDRPSAYEQVQGLGISNEFDSHGRYSLALGATAVVASVLLYSGYGLWWLNVGLGVGAIYFGVKGRRAASRSLATNPGVALTGMILGILGALASAAYLLLAILLIAILVGGAGA
jgi:hypothetical protein